MTIPKNPTIGESVLDPNEPVVLPVWVHDTIQWMYYQVAQQYVEAFAQALITGTAIIRADTGEVLDIWENCSPMEWMTNEEFEQKYPDCPF